MKKNIVAFSSNNSTRLLIIRVIFGIISLTAFTLSINNLAKVIDTVESAKTGKFIVPNSDYDFKETILAKAATAALTHYFDDIIIEALQNDDMDKAEIYVDLAQYLNVNLEDGTLEYYRKENGTLESAWRWASECLSGAITREAENLHNIMCMIGSDTIFPLWGDVIDLGKEYGEELLYGTEPDKLIISLSAISISLQAYEYYTENDTKQPPAKRRVG